MTAATRSPLRIVTDSSSCLTAVEAERLGVSILPLTLVVNGQEFDDGAGPTRENFYRQLRAGPEPPRTAALSPGALLERFRSLESASIVCITVAAAYSATHANALLAAERARAAGIDVRVVDSQTAAAAAGYVVRASAAQASRGGAVEEVIATAERTRGEVGVLMLLETLDYLARGGRVPRVAAWASDRLRVRPIVELANQRTRLVGRARTRRGGIESLLELMSHRIARTDRLHLTVQHADAASDADLLASLAAERLSPATLETVEFSQVMAAHVGPGLIGFSYWLERRPT